MFGGASTPGGATAQTFMADQENPLEGFASNATMGAKMKEELNVMKAQGEQLASAAEVNRATAAKTNKEAKILGPKSYLFEKIEEGIRSGAKMIDKMLPDEKDKQLMMPPRR